MCPKCNNPMYKDEIIGGYTCYMGCTTIFDNTISIVSNGIPSTLTTEFSVRQPKITVQKIIYPD